MSPAADRTRAEEPRQAPAPQHHPAPIHLRHASPRPRKLPLIPSCLMMTALDLLCLLILCPVLMLLILTSLDHLRPGPMWLTLLFRHRPALQDPAHADKKLTSLGIAPQFVTFTNVTMESDRYICVRETSPQNSVVIIDMTMPSQPLRRPITADSALMNPNTRILALKAQISGTTQDHLQIFNFEAKTKVKSHQMPVQVVFWKWITPKLLGLVTQTSVYHWSIEGDSEPAKMFDRTANLANNQIINYRCDPAEKWLMLIGIAPGAPERPQLVKGNMQLFSVGQQRSQALEAHAASFATIKVPGNENLSTLICFASKATNAGQITSKLTVAELGAQRGKPGFSMKQADLLFPPDFQDDFPVAMQISQKYGLVYLITKLGLLVVYDLETATTVYRNRISSDAIFLTAESSTTGGFYAINRRGQVLHATVNYATLVTFVSGQLNNPELAVNLAKRANLPADQRDSLAIGCNRLLTVTQDFYFQATGWRHTSRLKDA
ncbi:hypothetical protein QYE76_036738 [Lolium multiflorum]|uniref:Clathrin heavy chain linker core motif domain-containing protein n=1 Tax=Lolium multiflorum TaxID=4521 RepID=A0AAD8R1F4_LOLMU|nr:hypothetical protein QYE76_036738 [Lolium multiflorum]